MLERLTTDQKSKLDAFAELLCEANQAMNLTRITDINEIRVRHFEDSLVILGMLDETAAAIEGQPSLVDIGSGAGFPSIPLAIALPYWKIVSIESTGKKVDFQQVAAEELELENLVVLPTRAEKLGTVQAYRETFDVAVSRAVGHMAMIAELALPLLKTGGKLYAWKGPKLDEELAKANKISATLGGTEISQIPYRLSGVSESHFRIAAISKQKHTPRQYPREFKIIKAELG